MIPNPFTVYRMKEACLKVLFAGKVKSCATKCGNRFRYLTRAAPHINMECLRCGCKYHTIVRTFGDRYEKADAVDNSFLDKKNPNLLFKIKELSQ